MSERTFDLPNNAIEIRFEAYNKFHPENLPKIVYRTGNYDKLAEALHKYFINAYYTQYNNTGRITIDEVRIKYIVNHIKSAIHKFENVNIDFIRSSYDHDIERSIVNYKDNEFSIDIDDNMYFELKWLLKDLQSLSDSYKWNRYNVYATLYYV